MVGIGGKLVVPEGAGAVESVVLIFRWQCCLGLWGRSLPRRGRGRRVGRQRERCWGKRCGGEVDVGEQSAW